MTRALTAGFIAQAEAATNRPVVLFLGVFKTSTLRLWNGFGDITYSGQTWLGNGWFTGIDGTDESVHVEATTMTINLSGVPSSLISLILGDQKQGAAGELYIGFVDGSNTIIPGLYPWWKGKYSHADCIDGPQESTVRLHYESELVDFDRAREGRWTHESQQDLFPNDLGFQYVIAADNWNGEWGGEKKQKTNKSPPKSKGSQKGRSK